MAVFVPVTIESSESGVEGRFTFDQGYAVEGRSRDEVALKLYQAAAGWIQGRKDPAVHDFFHQRALEPGTSLIRVDLLSQPERALLFWLMSLKFSLIYLLAVFFLLCLYPFETQPLQAAQLSAFRSDAVLALYALVSGYIVLLLLLRRTLMQWFMDQYEEALLHLPMLRSWHLNLITRPAHCFRSQPYEYRGSLK